MGALELGDEFEVRCFLVVYAGVRIRGSGENVYFENMLIIM